MGRIALFDVGMSKVGATLIHATCVAISDFGVLITGKPGAGKSELALRLLDEPGYGIGPTILETLLVADDQVALSMSEGGLLAAAPENIKGLLEVRGLGIISAPFIDTIEIALVLELANAEEIERMPSAHALQREILGISLPCMKLDPHTVSAPARVRTAVLVLNGAEFQIKESV